MDGRCVALLRGVNVGGIKVLMQPLREMCEGFGWTNVQTYIASGNLIFRSAQSPASLADQLESGLASQLGASPPILILPSETYCDIVTAHPFRPEKGNQSHIYFCWQTPDIDADLYHSLKGPEEELVILNGHLHFYAPNGLGRSALASKFDRVILNTQWTGRNLNTAKKLVAMLDAFSPVR